jgi:hypothetical protein
MQTRTRPQAVFQVQGSNKRFPVVKDSYVTDANDMAKRSVLDGACACVRCGVLCGHCSGCGVWVRAAGMRCTSVQQSGALHALPQPHAVRMRPPTTDACRAPPTREHTNTRTHPAGDSFLPGPTASWRFRSSEVEPYVPSQAKGLPWFQVNKVCGSVVAVVWRACRCVYSADHVGRARLVGACTTRSTTLKTTAITSEHTRCTHTHTHTHTRARALPATR